MLLLARKRAALDEHALLAIKRRGEERARERERQRECIKLEKKTERKAVSAPASLSLINTARKLGLHRQMDRETCPGVGL